MTIHLSKDQESFIHDAVRAGLYASEDAVVADALERLKKSIVAARKAGKKAKGAKTVAQKEKPLTLAEIHQQMLASGLMTQLPDSAADYDDPDEHGAQTRIAGI